MATLSGGLLAFSQTSAAGVEALPLVQKSHLEYLGAFRLPRGGNGTTDGFSFGGGAIAHDSSNNSLYVATRESWVGKVRIPTPVKNADINALPFATLVQNIRDPLEGGLGVLADGGIRGLLLNGGKLYGTAFSFYDANNTARVSHFSRPADLSQVGATPLKALWQAERSGYVGGWLARVPVEWQSLLGGSVISGNCCVPIVSRTSFGPSAFAWNPEDFGGNPVPATPLLYYDETHQTLGPWSGSNQTYGGTTVIGGMAIPSGTRSLLYFGLNGTGTYCYGDGGVGGECPDPLTSDKGQHAYPYNHQVWAYDLNDLAAVKAGTKKPWEVRPYATWKIEDFPVISVNGIGGVAYDAANQIIYISQMKADTDGYSSRSLIHAYRINTSNTPATGPALTYTTPAPSSSPISEEINSPTTSSVPSGEVVKGSTVSSSGGAGTAPLSQVSLKETLIMKIMLELISLLQQLIMQLKLSN